MLDCENCTFMAWRSILIHKFPRTQWDVWPGTYGADLYLVYLWSTAELVTVLVGESVVEIVPHTARTIFLYLLFFLCNHRHSTYLSFPLQRKERMQTK